ncbi:MAG: S8 family serine peptidase, partial [Candidatus Heimdallarchaeota archaeon]|nr:S8 family serine peptidase [Candidatus Heimdallarchaeota archaeon]
MKRKSAIFLFVIFIVTSSLFVTQPNSIITEITEVAQEIDFPTDIDDLRDIIKRNSLKVDSNNDKISDYLNSDQDKLDAIILFEDFNFVPTSFNMGGISILGRYETLPALHVTMDTALLSIVSKLPGVAVIEENLELEPQLAYSTSQLGVRPFLWDQGLTGSSGYSIAVVDSGIDFSHSAFEGRIIASYNALNNNATLAIDTDGHGTHVAGIATGLPITSDTYTQTARGTLPSAGFFADILWANVNVSSSITVGMDWGTKGADNPGGTASILLVTESGGSFVLASGTNVETDTTGYFEVTFSDIVPGDYYVGFGNQGGAEDLDYEGWATLTYDSELPSQETEDGYEQYSGVAPGVNIVPVKVIDGNGDGSTNDFLNAMDWIVANKLTYNITVVNLSIGITVVQATLDSEIAVLANNGIISVVAAGNEGKNSGGIFSPGSAEEAITVGAVNRYNEIASYSSNGNFNSEPALSKPDIVAPGGSTAFPSITAFSHDSSYAEGLGLIIAPDSNDIGVGEKSNDLIALQGTSMASPHVAGLALLLMEKYSSDNTWQWTSSDVFRIKRAILAGSFEVANIGSAGGETVEAPDQTPSIQRTGKDNVEGWGAVNAQAALGALSGSIIFNQDISVSFNLEDPFTSNVVAWEATLESGTDYSFEAVVPVGVDVDLLIFDATTGNFGELQVLFSSTNGSGINEEINFSLTQSKQVMLVVRLVDSSSPLTQMDVVSIRMNNPNFIPNVTIIHPASGSFVNTPIVNVEFTSQTNSAEAFVDDISVGFISSGDPLPSITEGIHNLTLVEENTLSLLTDTDQSIFTLDLTKPTILSSNITNLDGLSVEDPSIISFSVDDDLNLDRVELLVGSVLGPSITIGSKPFSGTIEFNPRSFLPGVRTVELRVYDKAGNYDNITITIELVHSTFLIPQTDFTYEAENENPLV